MIKNRERDFYDELTIQTNAEKGLEPKTRLRSIWLDAERLYDGLIKSVGTGGSSADICKKTYEGLDASVERYMHYMQEARFGVRSLKIPWRF